MVGQQADVSLPLLLLNPQFGSTVSVCTAATEDDEYGPQQPEPCTQADQAHESLHMLLIQQHDVSSSKSA